MVKIKEHMVNASPERFEAIKAACEAKGETKEAVLRDYFKLFKFPQIAQEIREKEGTMDEMENGKRVLFSYDHIVNDENTLTVFTQEPNVGLIKFVKVAKPETPQYFVSPKQIRNIAPAKLALHIYKNSPNYGKDILPTPIADIDCTNQGVETVELHFGDEVITDTRVNLAHVTYNALDASGKVIMQIGCSDYRPTKKEKKPKEEKKD